MFDYVYGDGSKKVTFYRLPQFLFTNEKFHTLSNDAKVLYSLMLDKTGWSAKAGYVDENGRVFVLFSQKFTAERLNVGIQKAGKLMRELEDIGLIERKRVGQGNPDRIFVKVYTDDNTGCGGPFIGREAEQVMPPPPKPRQHTGSTIVESVETVESCGNVETVEYVECVETVEKLALESGNSAPCGSEKRGSRMPKPVKTVESVGTVENSTLSPKSSALKNAENHRLAAPKSDTLESAKSAFPSYYNTDLIYSDLNLSDLSIQTSERNARTGRMDKMDRYKSILEEVREQIDEESILDQTYVRTGIPVYSKEDVEELVDIIASVYASTAKSMFINGRQVPIEEVQERLKVLNDEHITYVLDCLKETSAVIKNRRSYLLTSLFNAPVTIDGYYEAKVRADNNGMTPKEIEEMNMYLSLVNHFDEEM